MDGVGGVSVPVQLAEPLRQDVVRRHGVHQAACGNVVADEARDDARRDGDAQQSQSPPSHGLVDGMEGGDTGISALVSQIGDVLHPAAVARGDVHGGNQRQQSIAGGAGQQSGEHDPDGFFGGKAEALRRVGNRFKAHKGPGSQHNDSGNLPRIAVPVRRVGRCQLRKSAVAAQHGAGAERNAQHQNNSHQRLDDNGQPFALRADRAEEQDYRQRQQSLAAVHIVSRHLIVEAPLQGGAEQVTHDQHNSGGVRPHNRHIHQHQEPCAEQPMVKAEGADGIGQRAARVRKPVHQIVVVRADEQHHRRADHHAQSGAHRPRQRQKCGAGHNESAPAHGAAQ